jgi:hypothetical protein
MVDVTLNHLPRPVKPQGAGAITVELKRHTCLEARGLEAKIKAADAGEQTDCL